MKVIESTGVKVIIISLVFLSLHFSGCVEEPDSEIDNPIIPSRGFYMGILPNPSSNQEFKEVYEQAALYAEFCPIWSAGTGAEGFWDYADSLSGSWGKTFLNDYIRGNDMFPIIHFSFIDQNDAGDLILKTPEYLSGANLENESWQNLYKNSILDVVETARPKYLSIGNEVNRWFEVYGLSEENPNGFIHFINLYHDIYDEVKIVSPETEVFCVFSREIVKENREANLSLLSYFNENKMDVLAFTTYPFSVQGINKPSDIPSDYYKKVADFMPNTAFGFTEIGWSSLDVFGGEQGQYDFLINISSDLSNDPNVDLLFFGYIWLHDQNEDDNIGLIRYNGTEKLAYTAWKQISQSLFLWEQQKNEQIVFMSKADSEQGELYLIDKTGNITRLTYNDRHENNPALSFDGTKIAFHAGEMDDPLTWEIFVLDLETLEETQLTNNSVIDGHPDWAPDGSRVVFASFVDDEGNPSGVADLYVINLNGSILQQLTDNEWEDNDPEWSPDGTKIAFKSTRNSKIDAREELFVMDADGTNVVQLTFLDNWESDHDPSWSSDSSKIAYMHFAGSRPWTDLVDLNTFINHWDELTPWNSCIVDLNGSNSQITNTDYIAQLAVFSKNDGFVLYLDNEFILLKNKLIGINHYFTLVNTTTLMSQRLLPEDKHSSTLEYFDW